MAHDVFISYAVADKHLAEMICRTLEENLIRCWYAPRDVPFGMDYEEAIVDAICESRFVILILSSHSNDSSHVRREIQNAYAEEVAIPVIPLRIENVSLSKALSYYLKSAQWLDASALPVETHLPRLVEQLRARLSRPPADEDAATETSHNVDTLESIASERSGREGVEPQVAERASEEDELTAQPVEVLSRYAASEAQNRVKEKPFGETAKQATSRVWEEQPTWRVWVMRVVLTVGSSMTLIYVITLLYERRRLTGGAANIVGILVVVFLIIEGSVTCVASEQRLGPWIRFFSLYMVVTVCFAVGINLVLKKFVIEGAVITGRVTNLGKAAKPTKVELQSERGNIPSQTSTTDEDGRYNFTGLDPGTYSVSIPLPIAGERSVPSINPTYRRLINLAGLETYINDIELTATPPPNEFRK